MDTPLPAKAQENIHRGGAMRIIRLQEPINLPEQTYARLEQLVDWYNREKAEQPDLKHLPPLTIEQYIAVFLEYWISDAYKTEILERGE
jgi:hypothetical protein